jgi:hypothetical protein
MPAIPTRLSSIDLTSFLLPAAPASLALDSSERSTFTVNSPRKQCKAAPNNGPSVHFDLQANTFHETWSRDDLSREAGDFSQLWYSSNDIKVLMKRVQTTVRMMNSGKFDGKKMDPDFSFRGIETESDKAKRKERLDRVRMALLWSSPTNTSSSRDDFFASDDVALTLQEISEKARQEAVLRAKYDRQVALKAYRKMR